MFAIFRRILEIFHDVSNFYSLFPLSLAESAQMLCEPRLENTVQNSPYHSLYNIETYEMAVQNKVEETAKDSALACMKLLHLERGKKVHFIQDNSYSVRGTRHEYSIHKSVALSQDSLLCPSARRKS